jgi:hypothetical protein
LSKHAKEPEAAVTTEQLARELIEAAAAIESLATRAANHAKALRSRAEAVLAPPDPDEVFLD